MKITTLSVEDGSRRNPTLTTTVHADRDAALASLRANYDPEHEYPDDDFVQSMIDMQGLVVHIEDHEVPSDPTDRSATVSTEHPNEHIILVAVSVTTEGDRKAAQVYLAQRLNTPDFRGYDSQTGSDYDYPRDHVDSWWFAEDDRTDGSDNSSAVFIPGDFGQGLKQREAYDLLSKASGLD